MMKTKGIRILEKNVRHENEYFLKFAPSRLPRVEPGMQVIRFNIEELTIVDKGGQKLTGVNRNLQMLTRNGKG